MKHVKTLNTKNLKNSAAKGGCGECQTSCQSACKTSCTVGNQACEKQVLITSSDLLVTAFNFGPPIKNGKEFKNDT